MVKIIDGSFTISTLNSKLPDQVIRFTMVYGIHLTLKGITKFTVEHNLSLNNWYRVLIYPQFGDSGDGSSAMAWAERFASTVANTAVYNVQSNTFDIIFYLTENTDIYLNINVLILV